MESELKIKNTSEISLEELHKIKEEGQISEIQIVDDNNSKQDIYYDRYSIDDLIKIKEKIHDEYISNIPQIPEDDPNREKKVFTYIYEKIANNVLYDEKAAYACDSGRI